MFETTLCLFVTMPKGVVPVGKKNAVSDRFLQVLPWKLKKKVQDVCTCVCVSI